METVFVRDNISIFKMAAESDQKSSEEIYNPHNSEFSNLTESNFSPLREDNCEQRRDRSRSPLNRRRDSNSRSRSRERRRNSERICKTRRLFISNIPYELRWQAVKDLFRKEVGEVTYVELPDAPDGKPLGSGLIEFKDEKTAQKALEKMDRYELRGRKIIVREETEKDRRRLQRNKEMCQRPDSSRSQSSTLMVENSPLTNDVNTQGVTPQILQQLGIEGPVTNQVFIANLDYKVTKKKLDEVFRLAGRITVIDLLEDKDGKSRGMATVQYETALEACQAISMFNRQMLYERAMNVKMDKLASSALTSGEIPRKLPIGLKGIGNPLNLNNMGSGNSNNNSKSSLLNSLGSLNSSVTLGSSGSMGFSASGMNFDSINSNSSNLLNSLTSSTSPNFFSGLNKNSTFKGTNSLFDMGGSFRDDYRENIYMSSSRERDRERRDSNSVFVRNLPFKYTWQDLKEKFRSCGEVRFAEIKTDNGKSKGCGIVRFHSHDSARRAIDKFDGVNVDGRRIEVRYDRMP